MYSPEQLASAYKKAVAAGDVEAAKELGNALNLAVEPTAVTAPGQRMVAGNPEQQDEARAFNLQQQMKLSDPVSPTGTVSMKDRFVSGFAPTPEEKQAYYDTQYGKGSWQAISNDRALVKVPDGKGGKHWVVDNPVGLDVGDVAQFQSNLPQFIAGASAAMAALPGPQGAVAKLVASSGAGALASNLVGAIQDVIYRNATNQPINAGEIASRRGVSSVTETALGAAIPFGVGKIYQGFKQSAGAKRVLSEFVKAGDEAVSRLRGRGINPATAGELGDVIRNTSPAKTAAADIGDEIANVINKQDASIRKASAKLAGRAASSADDRALAEIGSSTQFAPITAPQAGNAVIGAAKQRLLDANKAATNLLDSAVAEINQAGASTGAGTNIIKLTRTGKAIEELKGGLLQVEKKVELPDGTITTELAPSNVFLPLLQTLNQINQSVDVPQQLMAVRQVRSMLGAKISGNSDLFPGLDVGVAKKIYKSLSQDIDDSVSALTGPGAQKLRDYNTLYRSIIAPVEENPILGKIVNDGFNNPEEIVKYMAGGGSADWMAVKGVLPSNVYAGLRRSVVDELKGGSKIVVAGKEVSDVVGLNQKLASMSPEVKNELMGGSAPWKALEKIGREIEYLQAKGGLFSKQSLPSMNELSDAIELASSKGVDASNAYIKKALSAATARRNGLAESYLSQARNGNFTHIAQDPEGVLNSIVFNSNIRPEYVRSLVRKLPNNVRGELGDTAFQQIFENSRDVAKSMVSRKTGTYDTENIIRSVFGSRQKEQVVSDVIGPARLELIRDWMQYEVALQAKLSANKEHGKRIVGLIATAPYHNLFAARAASLALEKAAGSRLIAGVNPASMELFADARMVANHPKKTAASIALLQKALNNPQYTNYTEMMDGFTSEQQDAIDAYLTGR